MIVSMKKMWCFLFAVVLFLPGCEEFSTWKELNEEWIAEKRNTLGTGDDEIIEKKILPSGVLVEVYHNGYGAIPKPSVDPDSGKPNSQVVVTYKGWLIDGTEFNDAEKVTLSLSETVQGWQDALGQMRQGSHWKIYIPYRLGYGKDGSKKSGSGNFIVPPYSTLIFEIDLIDVYNN